MQLGLNLEYDSGIFKLYLISLYIMSRLLGYSVNAVLTGL